MRRPLNAAFFKKGGTFFKKGGAFSKKDGAFSKEGGAFFAAFYWRRLLYAPPINGGAECAAFPWRRHFFGGAKERRRVEIAKTRRHVWTFRRRSSHVINKNPPWGLKYRGEGQTQFVCQ